MEAYEIEDMNESTKTRDDDAWLRLTAEQFLAGYSDADAIYDELG